MLPSINVHLAVFYVARFYCNYARLLETEALHSLACSLKIQSAVSTVDRVFAPFRTRYANSEHKMCDMKFTLPMAKSSFQKGLDNMWPRQEPLLKFSSSDKPWHTLQIFYTSPWSPSRVRTEAR